MNDRPRFFGGTRPAWLGGLLLSALVMSEAACSAPSDERVANGRQAVADDTTASDAAEMAVAEVEADAALDELNPEINEVLALLALSPEPDPSIDALVAQVDAEIDGDPADGVCPVTVPAEDTQEFVLEAPASPGDLVVMPGLEIRAGGLEGATVLLEQIEKLEKMVVELEKVAAIPERDAAALAKLTRVEKVLLVLERAIPAFKKVLCSHGERIASFTNRWLKFNVPAGESAATFQYHLGRMLRYGAAEAKTPPWVQSLWQRIRSEENAMEAIFRTYAEAQALHTEYHRLKSHLEAVQRRLNR